MWPHLKKIPAARFKLSSILIMTLYLRVLKLCNKNKMAISQPGADNRRKNWSGCQSWGELVMHFLQPCLVLPLSRYLITQKTHLPSKVIHFWILQWVKLMKPCRIIHLQWHWHIRILGSQSRVLHLQHGSPTFLWQWAKPVVVGWIMGHTSTNNS
jgi:hypothetical protein